MNIATELEKYGISRRATREFTDGSPELLDYLDLIPTENSSRAMIYPEGVVENGDRPLLYYVNHTRLSSSPEPQGRQLGKLSRSIACRGERAYLAIIKPGLLEVAPVSLEDREPNWKQYQAGTSEALNFFTNPAHAQSNLESGDDPNLVFDEMFRLLTVGADRTAHKIGQVNALSLIGRALFFRFLCDREIITEEDRNKICPNAESLKACFDDAENTYRTSRWLDDTFNGDFLPFNSNSATILFSQVTHSTVHQPSFTYLETGMQAPAITLRHLWLNRN